ncbi:sensor histidine kinase [Streptomyces sp. KMM 9044]|uniref:sensor histidine kinase n=1 Tax=Streptomyces sp. KMM 9044 TaxID=2744474 RepID=UPI00215160B6|nr:nitrate- and nitrite sensing domain-containing protein [Streptomyces sp. KMM 9044]WAX77996.1 nitrate- and nitrite sensing domain-containing protein [Streptomyces sp. KMM 9044]
MQKTRPRRTGKQTSPTGDAEQQPAVGRGRPAHVRNRLIVAVAVVAAAIAAAGTPSLLTASGQLSDSQNLVTHAELTQDALTLAHSLADERDDVTSYVAAGRDEDKAPTEQHSTRVDRQVEELRADTGTPEALREDLDAIAALRRAALTGKSSPLEAHQAYSTAITQLHRLAEQLAEETPPRAGSGSYALAELDTAVQQAAATRGLLLAALNVPSTAQAVIDPVTGRPGTSTSTSDADAERRDALTAAALQARLRSDAALADFRETAPKAPRASYDSTVTGPEVDAAEKYLENLTDEPTLSDEELSTGTKKLAAALTARVEAMRGVESALFDQRTKDLAQLRDDDVTALEVRVALLGALLLLAVGVATAMARTLTRPLSVLRRGSARLAGAEDPSSEEPVAFTGRNDEFAQVVRSVNALHAHAAQLAGRITTLEADRKHLVAQRQRMADAREELRTQVTESATHLEQLRSSIGGTFVSLALRTLGLVERQLGVIEGLEEREDDPERLATLFKLDHFATVMRRHSENLLVLAGTEHVQHSAGPVPLVDVVRAAVSEIERYERVRIAALPPHAHIAGFAADDLSHLLAELLENATSFCPPDLPVEASGWLLESGEVMLSVQDEGIGMTGERLERLNARLSDFDPQAPYEHEGEGGLGLGLYVVARLARRHGVRVQLREQKQGGVAAVVVLPTTLLAAAPGAVPASGTVADGSPRVTLPGADAESSSHVLHDRAEGGDPLVALAEQAVQQQEPADDEPAGKPAAEPAGEQAGESVRDDALERTDGAADGPGASGAVDGVGEPADVPVAEQAGESVRDDALERTDGAADGPGASGAVDGVGEPADVPVAEQAGESVRDDALERTDGAADGPGASGAVDGVGEPADVPVAEQAGESVRDDALERTDGAADGPGASGAVDGVGEPADVPVAEQAGESVRDGVSEAGARAADVVHGAGEPADTTHERPVETTMELLIPAPALPADDQPARPATEIAGPAGTSGADTPAAHPGHPVDDTSAAVDLTAAPEATAAPGPVSPARPAPASAPVSDSAPDPAPPSVAEDTRAADGPAAERAVQQAPEPVTDKGLPKRTPKITAPVEAPRQRTGSVDADTLRRRLGGFRRGADAGRRDVEVEIGEEAGPHRPPSTAPSEEATGGTVEEATS